jgi:multiple sugar transport system permease protein
VVEPQRRGVPRRTPRQSTTAGQGRSGWLFVSPVLLLLGLFLIVPILMAAWVSVSDWTGKGSPFSGGVHFIGLDNYKNLTTVDGLARSDFAMSLRNNFYYVLLVVPIQTAIALLLAFVLNARLLKAKSFFRTAFYFPTVTSSVAITVVFLFLFSSSGVINGVIDFLGGSGPSWFADPRGLLHLTLDKLHVVDGQNPPGWLVDHATLGLSWWEWLAGPSVAMCAIIVLVIWTSAGGFMLMFLAALQDVSGDIEEAAYIDGAGTWQRVRYVILPMLRPTLFLVLTLGLIGTWQVFDQVYVGTQGGPAKTTLTPAYLTYQTSFRDFEWGQGAAIAFLLFALIVVLTLLQRWLLRERDHTARDQRRRSRRARRSAEVKPS